jgi:hypothetical protein
METLWMLPGFLSSLQRRSADVAYQCPAEPSPAGQAGLPAAHWLSWLILAGYVVGKGIPIVLRERGWVYDDPHELPR